MNTPDRGSAMLARPTLTRVPAALCLLVTLAAPVHAGDPLHELIDRAIDAKARGPVARRTTDAEFVRRVYLDLAGRTPSPAEAGAFFESKGDARRAVLIDRLLAGPEFPRRMQQVVTVRLLERRPGQAVTDADWNAYIEQAIAAGTPWNVLVRNLIATDGRDERHRPAIRFFADGNRSDPHQLTRDVGRIFLGMNLNCSQCHDDPNVEDFKQSDYFGLHAYLRQTQVRTDKNQRAFLIEAVVTDRQEFQSVFTGIKGTTGPLLPGGTELAVPKFDKGQELASPPRDGLPGTPKFRPRELLGEHLTANARFARSSVNYFWYVLMGRGLVHPLDMMHAANPPSHPELLDALAAEFAKKNYDLKHLFREIALSEAYQRSSVLPDGVTAEGIDASSYRVAIPRPLSAEQLAFSVMQATGQLERVLATPRPKGSKFTYKDYVNGRVPPPDSLPDVLDVFAATFGHPPGTPEVDFAPSASQALFLMNDKLILHWLAPKGANLAADLAKLATDSQVAAELYFRTLTRKPTEEEVAVVTGYLRKQESRRAEALGELAWALLTSAEFRFNH